MDRRQIIALGLAAAATGPGAAARAADAGEAIDAATLRAAEKLHAVNFPEDALARVAAKIPAQIASVEAVRRVPRPLALQPAFRFDPRLPGRSYPPQPDSIRLSARPAPPLPRDDAGIAYASVVEQSRWIASGALASERLTRIYLDRIRAIDPKLNAFITLAADAAIAEARARDAERAAGRVRGPLHGIPYALKDVIDAAGLATTWGSSLYRDRVPAEDAAVAAMLRAAGGVLLGKAATAELAYGSTWFGGQVRNPWNLDEPSGGSSAGPAAAVAAGLCGFAIGTDSLGSILHPSDRCGVAGLRATYGRVPVRGCMPLTPTLERLGPICRQVEDAALVLAAINGPDPASANSIDHGFAYDAAIDLAKLRVGYSPRWFGEGAPFQTDAPVTPAHRDALAAMRRLGVTLVEVEFPDLPYSALLRNADVEAAAIFEELTLSGQDARLIPPWGDKWKQVRFLSAVDYLQIERFRRQVMEVMDAMFERVDVIFSPTYATFQLVMIANFTGHPGLTLRCGFAEMGTRNLGWTPADPATPRRRVTCNVAMHGRLFEEGRLIALGRALETELDVWRERPPVG